jgi:SpoIID/LytB domain protein
MPDTIPTYHRARERQRARGRLRALRASLATGALSACCVVFSAGAQTPGAVAASAAELVVSGGGWGHGVGMSQQGALGYAEHGYSYAQILAHYYSGTALGQAPARSRVRVLIRGRVHSIALETYVRGVVSAEMPASWPAAALEAQAVATRTYALTAHAGGSRFDVYADTRSQVYAGPAAYTAATNAAVAATDGQIVTYAGAPAITYFFASSGGRTENVENAFAGATPEPWLRGVIDSFERGPLHTWTLSLTYARASARLRGLVRGTFEGIEVLKRGYSPRILAAYVLGSGGRTLVSGGELENRLGLDSTWAYFSSREGQTLQTMPDRSAQSSAAPARAPAEAPQGAAGGVQQSGAPEAAPAPASVARSGGTSAPASASAAYADGTPEQIAWVRHAASKFVSAELRGDGAGACSVLVARLRAPRGGVTCAGRWDAMLRNRLHDGRARAGLQRDERAIRGAHVEVRGASATIALPAALLSGHSRFLWTENCWMLTS